MIFRFSDFDMIVNKLLNSYNTSNPLKKLGCSLELAHCQPLPAVPILIHIPKGSLDDRRSTYSTYSQTAGGLR